MNITNKNLKHLLVLIGLFCSNLMFGQDENLEIDVVPPAPEAASLGKYGDIPVGYYTGTPSINIPIYTLKGRTLNVPVSLSYHASGLRVEEIASSVGLGWSLNAGGVITRTMVGLPDESNDGFLNTSITPAILEIADENELQSYYTDFKKGYFDTDPDLFNFNFMGRSGKFYLEKINPDTYKGVVIPHSDIEIIFDGDHQWVITTEDGTKYYFGKSEDSQRFARDWTNYGKQHPADHGATASKVFPSAWHLLDVVSPNKENVSLHYSSYTEINYWQRMQQTKSYTYLSRSIGASHCYTPSDKTSFRNYTVGTYKLESIKTVSGEINFHRSSTPREDLPDDYPLEFIEVINNQNQLVKKFELKTSYFSNGGFEFNSSGIEDGIRLKRLKLDAIIELKQDNTPSNNKHEFKYNSKSLPELFSFQQDHWGFYNGKYENESLIPITWFVDALNHIEPISKLLSGANKHADPNYTKACILEEIKYPTGGITKFHYENNTALTGIFEGELLVQMFPESYAEVSTEGTQIEDIQPFTVDSFEENENGELGAYLKYSLETPTPCDFTIKGDGGCGLQLYIEHVETGDRISLNALEIDDYVEGYLFFKNGNYNLILEKQGSSYSTELSCKVYGPKDITTYINEKGEIVFNRKVGGVRISKVENYANINEEPITTIYKYQDFENPLISSGKLVNKPLYHYVFKSVTYVKEQTGNMSWTYVDYPCYKLVRTASSQIPLGFTHGSPVGYNNVEVFYGKIKKKKGQPDEYLVNGKSRMYYTSSLEFPDNQNMKYPFAPSYNQDYKRGLLLKQIDFKVLNNVFSPIKEITNDYFQFSNNPIEGEGQYAKDVTGLRLGCSEIWNGQATGVYYYEDYCNQIHLDNYYYPTMWVHLDKTTEKVYDQNDPSKVLQTEVQYFYDNVNRHVQQTRTITKDSEGNEIENRTFFPWEVVTTGMASSAIEAISEMKNSHMLNTVIENKVTKKSGYSMKTLSKSRVNYGLENNLIVQKNVELATTDGSYEKRADYHKYDIYGNILEFSKTDDVKQAFIWGYNNTLPIARVINASSNQIYYNGFEEDPNAITTEYKTGRKGFSGNFTIPGSSIATGDYQITYWQKVNNDWELVSEDLNHTGTDISLSGIIDDVRIFPKNSQMETYTYDPLIGMTSKTDVNNFTSYFEYDDLGRLKLIKDFEGNILKKNEYNYAH